MKCMHCLIAFHDNEQAKYIGEDVDGSWSVLSVKCPSCNRLTLYLGRFEETIRGPNGSHSNGLSSRAMIRPRGATRSPCPPQVPAPIAEDYIEACVVLPDSPKASAALSRRCLQNLLRQAANVKHSDLANEIQQVIDGGSLPSDIVEMMDAVRNIGNFAAHPLKSKSTGEILPVEPQEAEWNLDVLEELFDFYFVRPAVIAKKRDALNQKLKDAGKPPMK